MKVVDSNALGDALGDVLAATLRKESVAIISNETPLEVNSIKNSSNIFQKLVKKFF